MYHIDMLTKRCLITFMFNIYDLTFMLGGKGRGWAMFVATKTYYVPDLNHVFFVPKPNKHSVVIQNGDWVGRTGWMLDECKSAFPRLQSSPLGTCRFQEPETQRPKKLLKGPVVWLCWWIFEWRWAAIALYKLSREKH